MARNVHAEHNSFLNAFMQGYSFVDNIYARKQRQKQLEEELAYRRARQQRMDELVMERQRWSRDDRRLAAEQRERANAARAIMASPNPDLDLLQKEYGDLPFVTEWLMGENEKNELQGYLEDANVAQPGFAAQVQGAAQGAGQAQAPPPDNSPQNAAMQAAIAAVPPAPGAVPEPKFAPGMTMDQLNDAVQTGEMTEAEAREYRDQKDDMKVWSTDTPSQAAARATRREKLRQASSNARVAEDIAASFADVNDPSGDVYRDWAPRQAVDWYHNNRSNIKDPALLEKTDNRMRERVVKTVNAADAIMRDLEIPHDSNEYRAAARDYSKAMGLAQAMGLSRKPDELAGADNRGVSRRNTAMLDNTIAQAAQGTFPPLPGNPDKHRADMAVANRGNSGVRVSKKYADAAYGLLSRKIIDLNIYSTMMRTGAPLGQILAAQGIDQKIVQGDPGKDTFLQYIDPATGMLTRKLIIPARKIPSLKDMQEASRNTFDDDALAHLYNNIAPIYNTDEDKQRGKRLVKTFIEDMAGHELTARAEGYSFRNLNDAATLFRRWNDMHVLSDAYNRENDGIMGWSWTDFTPEFTTEYGTINENIFNRNFDTVAKQVIEEQGLKTTGGTPVQLTPLKNQFVSDEQIAGLRLNFPELTQGKTDEDIRAALARGE